MPPCGGWVHTDLGTLRTDRPEGEKGKQTMNEGSGRQADFGGIIGETTALVSDTITPALLLTFVIAGIAFAGEMTGLVDPDNVAASLGFGFMVDGDDGIGSALFGIIGAVVSVVGSYFYLQHLLASRGALGEGGTRIWAYVGLTIISSLGMIVGFLALIVPGIVVMCRWSASSGFLLGERTGVVDSMGESWDATRGRGWPIFFAGLAMFAAYLLIAAAVGGAVSAAGEEIIVAAAAALAEGFGTVLSLAFGIAVYLLVHDRTTQVSEVFA